jgi:hypothetical protein
VKRREAGNDDALGVRQRGPPRGAAGDPADEQGVRRGGQPRLLRYEARETVELADRPRHQEAAVAIDIGLAAVVDPAVVAEGEGIHVEAPSTGPGDGRGRASIALRIIRYATARRPGGGHWRIRA